VAKVTMTFEDIGGMTVKTSVDFGPKSEDSRAKDMVMGILEYMSTTGGITKVKHTPRNEVHLNG